MRDDRYQRQRSIEGYVSHASIRAGETLTGFVSTNPAAPYRVEVYRMGWYGGKGGRLMTTLGTRPGVVQPEPVEGDKQLMEARWRPSFEIVIPSDWLSGVYLGKLTNERSGDQSYVIWVVRDDRKADLMFQVSDLTWQAYNRWPAWRSLYDWKQERWRTTPGAKVSFDRPVHVLLQHAAGDAVDAQQRLRRVPALGVSARLLARAARLRRDVRLKRRYPPRPQTACCA